MYLYFIVPPELPMETEKKDKKGKKGKGKLAAKESKPNVKAATENEAKGKINIFTILKQILQFVTNYKICNYI